MPLKIVLTFLICIYWSSANSQSFNGYLIKLKNGYKSLPIKKTDIKKNIITSFGNFIVLKNKQVIKSIKTNAIEYIEPNFIYSLHSDNRLDAGFGMQWGLENLGSNVIGGVAGNDINIIPAWNITTGSKQIVIAVIDSGIDLRHNDLKNNLWINEAEKNGLPMYDDDGNGYIDDIYGYDFVYDDGSAPMDNNSHGTHCAGIIGAAHNGLGIMGVMGKVKLMALKFASANGSAELADALRAIDYAVKNGANIISASWGGDGESKALYQAIKVAQDNGVLFVTAAGNEGSNTDQHPHYPSSYQLDNIVAVGALAPNGTRASFSNFGTQSVDLFAPGVDIFSTVKNNNYQIMSGTSMATPFVAGALGLLLSEYPNLGYMEAKQRLLHSCDNTTVLKDLSVAGKLNVLKMLKN